MSIKYHDNIHGQQYGADHKLTDNWNSDPIYGENEYSRVFFRIDCPAYVFNSHGYPSWENEERRQLFRSEAGAILKRFGIHEGIGGRFEDYPMEHLHIHPQEISGVLSKNKIKTVAEALDACASFSVRWVDVYEDISPMTNAEYLSVLEQKRNEIESELLEILTTKRRNLYICLGYGSNPLSVVADKHFIPRREAERSTDDGTGINYVRGIFDDLVDQGRIVSAETKHGTGYRTAKKDELSA